MEEKLLNLYINILNYNEKVSLWEITHYNLYRQILNYNEKVSIWEITH